MTTPFGRIPQPMLGMNWEPSPSNYTSLPAPPQYGDTDFANDDFVALWNVDSNGVGRYDLKTIAGMGCNTIKMYNWSVPAPNGYWMRNHANFLAMAAQLNLSVIVPISNFFTGTAYNNRAAASGGTVPTNQAGPPASASLSDWITDIVTEIYQNASPGPAIMWAIGNEYDNANLGAYGYCEATDIATIASYIMAAEQSLGISGDNVLAFTSPVTTALVPVNTSIPSAAPYNTLMGGCAIQALLQAFTTALGATVTQQRFLASINSYQIGSQLLTYNTAFPGVFPGVGFFYGELGWSDANGGDATQATNVGGQFSTVLQLATAGQPFYGACCFEFSDELWKGPAGSSETTFGLSTFAGTSQTSSEGNHSPVWGAQYPVDALSQRPAYAAFVKALGGS